MLLKINIQVNNLKPIHSKISDKHVCHFCEKYNPQGARSLLAK